MLDQILFVLCCWLGLIGFCMMILATWFIAGTMYMVIEDMNRAWRNRR